MSIIASAARAEVKPNGKAKKAEETPKKEEKAAKEAK